MANPKNRQVQGMQKTSLGLLAGGHKLQANLGEAAFSPPGLCQQGTPGNPRSRRGRKAWRKTNLRLPPAPRKNKKREENHVRGVAQRLQCQQRSLGSLPTLLQGCLLGLLGTRDLPLCHQTRVSPSCLYFIPLSLWRADYYPK